MSEINQPRRSKALKKSTSQGGGQKTLLSFFGKKSSTSEKVPVDKGITPNTPPSLSQEHNVHKDLDQMTGLRTETRLEAEKDIRKQVKHGLPTPITPHLESGNEFIRSSNLNSVLSSDSVIPSSPSTNSSSRTRKRVDYAESSDEENDDAHMQQPKKTKQRHKIVDDDDDEEDYKPDADDLQESNDEIEMDGFIVPDDEEDEGGSEDDEISTARHKSRPKPKAASTSLDKVSRINHEIPSSPPVVKQSLEKFSSGSSFVNETKTRPNSFKQVVSKAKSFEKENEERYSWLIEVRDAEGHLENHPEYDPRSLLIPKSAWSRFTAFERQYWEVKSKMWNTVVFFKKGKFYELYERDADIAHSEFDLKLAGGGRANMRLAGVPEMSFDYWASAFIAKGHKVAKVDQKETALAKEMRESGQGKKEEKIIRRELSCVLTAGTLTDGAMLVNDMSTYCMAVKESKDQSYSDTSRIAVCFVDTSTGAFWVTEFEDDSDYSKFETLIAQIRPRELILEKGLVSQKAVKILRNNTSVDTIWNYLKPLKEFWDHEIAYEELVRSKYFESQDMDDLSKYPEVLKDIAENKPLSMNAFGGMLWYLKSLKIDQNLVSLGNFSIYDTVRKSVSMVLDGQSLQNLELFANTYDGGKKGTLFEVINRCTSPFGKRKMKEWLCHPLINIDQINARLDAVDSLIENSSLRDYMERCIASLPDLERLLSRVHAGQIKVIDFVKVIEGFESIYSMISGLEQKFEIVGVLAQMLESAPYLEECLPYWANAFDRDHAKNSGILIPEAGAEQEFDESNRSIADIEERLMVLLRQYRREYKSQEICFRDSGKEIYLIEIPVKIKHIPKSWQQMSSTAKVKRYWSPEVRSLVRELMEARETHKLIVQGVTSRMYAQFDKFYMHWVKATKLIANIDCLLSLAKTSMALGVPNCRPQFVDSERSLLDFVELRHPCAVGSSISKGGTTEFIPNDIMLGGDNESMALLTGANAAGKSTILRMTCVAVIMAQVGCYVPCKSARLTPVDRIMTRLGANDNIFAGKSTFFVELSETKRILSEATNRSLLVLDELGRGGSSSDGFAIAEAVLHHIVTHIGSLGFFATHYGTLYNGFQHHPEISAKRMAILVDENSRQVTFLYKLEQGVSPGSFGMHVAAMCGIDSSIVERAEQAAREFEHTSRMKKLLDVTKGHEFVPLGLESDFVWAVKPEEINRDQRVKHALNCMIKVIESL